MDGELAVGLLIACVVECGCKFVNVTLVTALQKSSECRKWTRAGTCRPKRKVRVASSSTDESSISCSYCFI